MGVKDTEVPWERLFILSLLYSISRGSAIFAMLLAHGEGVQCLTCLIKCPCEVDYIADLHKAAPYVVMSVVMVLGKVEHHWHLSRTLLSFGRPFISYQISIH